MAEKILFSVGGTVKVIVDEAKLRAFVKVNNRFLHILVLVAYVFGDSKV